VKYPLTKRLKARVAPLAVLLAATVALSAPLVLLTFGLHGLRQEADTIARDVASLIEREAVEDRLLWKYNVPKLVRHLRAYRGHPDVARIEVVDAAGARIATGASAAAEDQDRLAELWASAAIGGDDRAVGQVWVAIRTARAYREALLALVLFALVGGGLGWLSYSLPMRSVARAEAMIGGLLGSLQSSQQELSEVNESLERRVAERSAQLRQAYAELQGNEANLRRVSTEAVLLQERERRAIARELHDAVGQALTAVRINLQLLEEGGDQRGELGRLARQSAKLVDEALEEVRRAVSFLGPAILDEIGLEAAVRRHCSDLAERTGIDVEVEVDIADASLPPAVESTCYRVVQEALNNVVKHASAKRARVFLAACAERVSLEIDDDGRGMDPAAGLGAGRGLAGMGERIYLWGGEVSLDSGRAQGMVLRASLPLRAASGDARSDEPVAPSNEG